MNMNTYWMILALILSAAAWRGISAESQWSEWFNYDNPLYDGNDDETIGRIGSVCPKAGQQVTSAQCRQAGHSTTFTDQTVIEGVVLHVPCNATGLLCRGQDQSSPSSSSCPDFEVRFCCGNVEDDDTSDVATSGAFIVIIASGSVVLPLGAVIVLQLRKSKLQQRQERERQARAADSDQSSDSEQSAVTNADLPPAYNELFLTLDPVSVVGSSEEGGASPNYSEQRRMMGEEGGTPIPLVSGNDDVERGFRRVAGIENSSSSLSVSSDSSSSMSTRSESSAQSMLTEISVVSIRTVPADSLASNSPSLPAVVRPTSLTSPPPSSHTSSESTPGTDPPPAYDLPGQAGSGSGHVTVVMPAGSESQSDSSALPAPASSSPHPVTTQQPAPASTRVNQRRLLGMHLSIFDLMASMYHTDPTTPTSPTLLTPPPTYEDALKILEVVSTQPKVGVR